MSVDDLTSEMNAILSDLNTSVATAFPGGLEKLDLYDDSLPAGVPSWSDLVDRADVSALIVP